MVALLQRVAEARVSIEGSTVGCIGPGLVVFIGMQRGDGEVEGDALLRRLLAFRVFADAAGRMNRSVTDVGGGVLLVPQFTLAADTRCGTRPSFSRAAAPERARTLYAYCLGRLRTLHPKVASGEFGRDMQVALVNDGPVTFWLEVPPSPA